MRFANSFLDFHSFLFGFCLIKACSLRVNIVLKKNFQAGYISEILTWAALDQGKNVLVDGSLRDHEWYIEHFAQLRGRYNGLNIAILHITASREDVIERAMVSITELDYPFP